MLKLKSITKEEFDKLIRRGYRDVKLSKEAMARDQEFVKQNPHLFPKKKR